MDSVGWSCEGEPLFALDTDVLVYAAGLATFRRDRPAEPAAE